MKFKPDPISRAPPAVVASVTMMGRGRGPTTTLKQLDQQRFSRKAATQKSAAFSRFLADFFQIPTAGVPT